MSMRYIARRAKPEDLSEIKAKLKDLDAKLPTPAENLRYFLDYPISEKRYLQYAFLTRKEGTNWVWVCPSIEFVAEDEKAMLELTQAYGLPGPAHLKHLI